MPSSMDFSKMFHFKDQITINMAYTSQDRQNQSSKAIIPFEQQSYKDVIFHFLVLFSSVSILNIYK